MLRKALIDKPSGTVIGILEVSEKGFGKLTAGNDQIYWDCTRWAVQPGDKFADGVFYTQADPSTPVQYVPTTEEKLAVAESAIAGHDSTIDAMLGITAQPPAQAMARAATAMVEEAPVDKAAIASQVNAAMRILAEQQTDEEMILMIADLYETWTADRSYKKDKILAYGKDALGDTQLYKVIQDHKSQADWTPDKAPSLYTTIGLAENGIPMWRQPTAAFDAYNTGDQCVCDGYVWTSKIDGNTTRPGSDDRWWTKGEAAGGEDPGPEPEPGDVPDWDEVETGYQFKTGTQFTYQGKTYNVLRDMAKTPGWEPPTLLGDYYEEA